MLVAGDNLGGDLREVGAFHQTDCKRRLTGTFPGLAGLGITALGEVNQCGQIVTSRGINESGVVAGSARARAVRSAAVLSAAELCSTGGGSIGQGTRGSAGAR